MRSTALPLSLCLSTLRGSSVRFQLFLDPAGLWWAASGSSTPATQHLGTKGWGPAVRSPLKMAHRPRGEVLLEYGFLRGRDFWLFSSLLTPQSLE